MRTYIVLISLTIFLFGCTAVGKNANEVVTMLEKEQYEEADERLEEIRNDDSLSDKQKEKIEQEISEEVIPTIDSLVKRFKDDDVDVDTLTDRLYDYKSLSIESISKITDEARTDLNELIQSRIAFVNGEDHYKEENYQDALNDFLKVNKVDVKYEQAQDYISTIKPVLLEEVKTSAEEKKKEKKYEVAYALLKGVEKYYKDNKEFMTLLEEYKENYIQSSLSRANDLRAKDQFTDALNELDSLKKEFNSNQEISKLISEIEEDYSNYQEQKKNNLLAKMNVQYDSMNDITRISPKGKDAFTLDIPLNGYIFFPFIQKVGKEIKKDVTVLSVVAGFSQDDWVFMDRIQFNADGDRFTWDLDYGEATTDVGWGTIYEYVIKNDIFEDDLKGDLEKIAYSKKVEIRFDGDNNSRNQTLTNTHKQQIKDILELHDLINDSEFDFSDYKS